MPPDPIAYLNGRFVRPADLALSHADAGVVFGATVADFCRTYNGRLFRWPAHLARFRRDCLACRVPLPTPDDELTAAAERLVADNMPMAGPVGEVAVVTFATPGPVGYLTGAGEDGPPTVGMHAVPLPVGRYRRFFADGVTLAAAGVRPADPAGIVPPAAKHRSRLQWWLADRAVGDPGGPAYFPGAVPVLLDPSGTPDTAVGAVLAVAGEAVVRPVPGTVLEGVSLGVVEELCRRVGLRFTDAPLDFRTLCRPAGGTAPGVAGLVTELLLAGSGFGLAGVRRFVGPGTAREFDWPGPVLRKLLAAWSEEVGLDVEGQMLGTLG